MARRIDDGTPSSCSRTISLACKGYGVGDFSMYASITLVSTPASTRLEISSAPGESWTAGAGAGVGAGAVKTLEAEGS
jgi:hypothetical protein